MKIVDVYRKTTRTFPGGDELYVFGANKTQAEELGAKHELAIRFGAPDMVYGNDSAKDKLPLVTDKKCIKFSYILVVDLNKNIILFKNSNDHFLLPGGTYSNLIPNVATLHRLIMGIPLMWNVDCKLEHVKTYHDVLHLSTS
jgi:hypothetical protein